MSHGGPMLVPPSASCAPRAGPGSPLSPLPWWWRRDVHPHCGSREGISSQLPAWPDSGPGTARIQVHSAWAGAGADGGDMPGPGPDPGTSRAPLFLLWGPTRPPCPFPYFLLRRAGLGWGLAVLARFEDAPRGRNWDLGRRTLSYRILSSLPRTLLSPGGLPGADPTGQRRRLGCRSRASRVGPSASPTVGRGGSGLPAGLVRGEEKVPPNQSPA